MSDAKTCPCFGWAHNGYPHHPRCDEAPPSPKVADRIVTLEAALKVAEEALEEVAQRTGPGRRAEIAARALAAIRAARGDTGEGAK